MQARTAPACVHAASDVRNLTPGFWFTCAAIGKWTGARRGSASSWSPASTSGS
ncbi:hypothetical protein [Ralstonia solanacearum]|uniref:hypothetical protein n=1 Tax=Ralstonia solanacearum TaxID=305 RepID=UPI001FFD8160|nr:hypothetical protein [Ralstonia solanacearum]